MSVVAVFEKTVARLRKHEGAYAEIARQSGISYSSLVKLAQGYTPNPTVDSLQKVIDALDAFEGVVKPPPAPAEPDPDSGRVVPFEAPP